MFEKVLVANRGEIAIRVMRTLKEMGIASVGVYSEADRDDAPRARGRRGLPARARRCPPRATSTSRRSSRSPRSPAPRRSIPGYGFLAENAAFATALDEAGIVFIGPPAARDRGDGLEDPGPRDHAGGRRADRARRHRAVARRRGGPQDRRGDRLPGRLQGRRRRRRQGLPRRADRRRPRRGLRGRGARGREVLLRRPRLPRALPRGSAPRRGPGARRLARQRDPPRRARLLDPAPPPEADRGGARPARRRGDARADRQDRHRGGARRRLPRRRARSRGCRSATSTSSSR